MNLLLINNEFPPIGGGGSTVTKYAVRELVRAGHDVTLITSRYKDLPKQEIIDGGTVIRIPAIRRYADYCSMWELIIFGVSALAYTLRHARGRRFDFVQAYFALPAGWVAWLTKMFLGIPYGVYFGGSDIPNANPTRYKRIYPLLAPLLRTIWRGAEFRTVCSEELAELGRKSDQTVDFKVVPNGVDTDRFTPIDRPANTKVKILFIGRLIPRKGLHRVIEALPKVRDTVSTPFEVEVVGTGSQRETLNEMAGNLGVSDLINYVGTIPYDKLHEAYQGADIFILTSLSEGMPAVILEAMGCGLPVIASDVGGNNEVVHEGENGYLIPEGGREILESRMAMLINDVDLRQRMGSKSRQISQKFDWREIMRIYHEFYMRYS